VRQCLCQLEILPATNKHDAHSIRLSIMRVVSVCAWSTRRHSQQLSMFCSNIFNATKPDTAMNVNSSSLTRLTSWRDDPNDTKQDKTAQVRVKYHHPNVYPPRKRIQTLNRCVNAELYRRRRDNCPKFHENSPSASVSSSIAVETLFSSSSGIYSARILRTCSRVCL